MALSVGQKLTTYYQKVDLRKEEVAEKVVRYVAVAAIFVLIASLVHFTQFFDGHSLFLMRAVSVMAACGFLIAALHQHVARVEKMKQAALFTTLVAITSILAFAAFSSALHFDFSSYVTMGLIVGATLSLAAASALVYHHRKDKEPPKAITADNFEEILRERNSEGLNLFQEAMLNEDIAKAAAFLEHGQQPLLDMPLADGRTLLQAVLQKNPNSKMSQALLLLRARDDCLTEEQYAFLQPEFQQFFAFLRQDQLSDSDVEAIKALNIFEKLMQSYLNSINSEEIIDKILVKFDNFKLYNCFFQPVNIELKWAINKSLPKIALGILKSIENPDLTFEEFQRFKDLYEKQTWLDDVLPIWQTKMDLPDAIDLNAESFNAEKELDEALAFQFPQKLEKLLRAGYLNETFLQEVQKDPERLAPLFNKFQEKPGSPLKGKEALKFCVDQNLPKAAEFLVEKGFTLENIGDVLDKLCSKDYPKWNIFPRRAKGAQGVEFLRLVCERNHYPSAEILVSKGFYHLALLTQAEANPEFLKLLDRCQNKEQMIKDASSSNLAKVKAHLKIQ